MSYAWQNGQTNRQTDRRTDRHCQNCKFWQVITEDTPYLALTGKLYIMGPSFWVLWEKDIDGLMQERRNSIANALELRLSCTNPSLWDITSALYCWCNIHTCFVIEVIEVTLKRLRLLLCRFSFLTPKSAIFAASADLRSIFSSAPTWRLERACRNWAAHSSDVTFFSRWVNSKGTYTTTSQVAPVSWIQKHQWLTEKEPLNSLWPSDAIRLQGTESTLAQVMACCLTAPSHYLNQCWLIISKIQLHSSDGNFARDTSVIND